MDRETIREFVRTHQQVSNRRIVELLAAQGVSVTENAVSQMHRRMGLPPKDKYIDRMEEAKEKAVTPETIEHDRENRSHKVKLEALTRKNKELLAMLDQKDEELSAVLQLADATTDTHFSVEPREHSEAVAVVIASDWHVEEEVKPDAVNGKNRYNLDISKASAERFFNGALKLVRKEQQDVNLNTMIVMLGGDFISSNIHEDIVESCLLRPVEAAVYAMNLLEAGIKFLLENSELNLVVPCHSGNHGRITSQQRIANEKGNSLEYFMYYVLANRFANEPRIQFIVSEGYHQYISTMGSVLRTHHGHYVSYGGGVGGITIPINKAIAQWNSKDDYADIDAFG